MALGVRRLSYGLGAEITGLDLRNPLDAATAAEIRKIWLENQVIVIRGQDITPAQQVDFGRHFGTLDDHKSLPFYRLQDHPEIFLITNKNVGGKPSETKDTGRLWHSDHSFTTHPTMASALYCREIPSVGGDTLFTNMYMAYDTLSDTLKRILDPLEAIHDITTYAPFRTRNQEQIAEMYRINPPVAQPVVRVHPETGRKALYVSEALTFRFVGMTEAESRGLLEYLWRHSIRPEFTYRHQWKVGDLLMWDNRCAMHMAPADYTPGEPRLMHRITILGTPSGRIYREEPAIKAAA
ncbi:MAG: taurine dioxygenase [Betaproteobacteria bacterium]|nr:TauD/TfdA family dioxygenase [Rhodocyclaceae bacterium]